MNKRAIWIIIGLMSAALLGVIFLQAYWINWSINLEEKRFDKDVFSALNVVADKLQRYEEIKENLEALSHIPGFQERFIAHTTKKTGYSVDDKLSVDFFISRNINLDSILLEKDIVDFLNGDDLCDDPNCDYCQPQRYRRSQQLISYWSKTKVYQYVSPPPINQRINLEALDKFIDQELESRGIRTKFNYGVYSTLKKSFIIQDGHYVVEDDNSPQSTLANWNNLVDSKYKVRLFPSDINLLSPGLLMIHFPSKASVVWRSGWKTLLASILFTGIILFCFTYTVQVIFRQKKLSEMKTDFINNMTHEFKTPIATISLAADSITSPMISNDAKKVSRFADIIKQENKRMNNQVEKVLQMARIDRKEFDLKLTQVNVHEVIEQAIENSSLTIEKRGGTLSSFLEASHPIIQGDATHISNVIHNLVENANKYSPDTPVISIHTKNINNGVQIMVKDRGIGMTKEARKHIFDKFYRVHTGNLHDVKGFGLGLSYVKAIMTTHKGQIDVKSELGKGSSFILFFPFVVEQN